MPINAASGRNNGATAISKPTQSVYFLHQLDTACSIRPKRQTTRSSRVKGFGPCEVHPQWTRDKLSDSLSPIALVAVGEVEKRWPILQQDTKGELLMAVKTNADKVGEQLTIQLFKMDDVVNIVLDPYDAKEQVYSVTTEGLQILIDRLGAILCRDEDSTDLFALDLIDHELPPPETEEIE